MYNNDGDNVNDSLKQKVKKKNINLSFKTSELETLNLKPLNFLHF